MSGTRPLLALLLLMAPLLMAQDYNVPFRPRVAAGGGLMGQASFCILQDDGHTTGNNCGAGTVTENGDGVTYTDDYESNAGLRCVNLAGTDDFLSITHSVTDLTASTQYMFCAFTDGYEQNAYVSMKGVQIAQFEYSNGFDCDIRTDIGNIELTTTSCYTHLGLTFTCFGWFPAASCVGSGDPVACCTGSGTGCGAIQVYSKGGADICSGGCTADSDGTASTGELRIGTRNDGVGDFAGAICDFAIFKNDFLTPAEQCQYCCNGLDGLDTDRTSLCTGGGCDCTTF